MEQELYPYSSHSGPLYDDFYYLAQSSFGYTPSSDGHWSDDNSRFSLHSFLSTTPPPPISGPSGSCLVTEQTQPGNTYVYGDALYDPFINSSATLCHSHDNPDEMHAHPNKYSRGLGLFVATPLSVSEPPALDINSSAVQTSVSPLLLVAPSSSQNNDVRQYWDTEDSTESDNSTDSGSEYTPSTVLNLKQRVPLRRSARTSTASQSELQYVPSRPRHTIRPTSSLTSGFSGSPSAIWSNTESSYRIRTAPRRAQRQGTPNYEATDAAGDFCCEVCGYTCKPHRRIDFRRHVNTHYPHMAGGPNTCCGVPVEYSDIPEWREQLGQRAESPPVRTFYGMRMVGGCGKVFSRTDALIRHLASARNSCVGDPDGDWHPPRQRD